MPVRPYKIGDGYKIGEHPLEEFEWDSATGAAVFSYRAGSTDTDGYVNQEQNERVARHPMAPGHLGWSELGQRTMGVSATLTLIGTRVALGDGTGLYW